MAIIKKIIERVDRNKPNAFSEEDKLGWIAELDGLLAMEVFLMDVVETAQFQYVHPNDLERETLVRFPHDSIYDAWLEAKIDYHNGEYEKYQNSMEMYNAGRKTFERWFASTYNPALGYRKEGWW